MKRLGFGRVFFCPLFFLFFVAFLHKKTYMVYEHLVADPVNKIQVTDTRKLFDKWLEVPDNMGATYEDFFQFLQTPAAETFILQHQQLHVELNNYLTTLTSKFA